MVTSLICSLLRRLRSESAQAGTVTAIVLTCTAVAGGTVAVGVYELGDEGSQALQQTVNDSLDHVTNNLELRGGITATDLDHDSTVGEGDRMTLTVALGPGGATFPLDPATGLAPSISVFTESALAPDASYTVEWRRGEGPTLEPGELADIFVIIPAGISAAANQTISLEVVASTGGSMVLERRLPSVVQGLTYLF